MKKIYNLEGNLTHGKWVNLACSIDATTGNVVNLDGNTTITSLPIDTTYSNSISKLKIFTTFISIVKFVNPAETNAAKPTAMTLVANKLLEMDINGRIEKLNIVSAAGNRTVHISYFQNILNPVEMAKA